MWVGGLLLRRLERRVNECAYEVGDEAAIAVRGYLDGVGLDHLRPGKCAATEFSLVKEAAPERAPVRRRAATGAGSHVIYAPPLL